MTHRQLVLIIDDHEDSRQILRTVLEYAGCSVAECDGGRAGVRRARELLPAAIFLALDLRSLSGFEVLSLLRLDPLLAGIPTVAMSAYDLEPEALASGFAAYVAKPFSLPTLLATVHELLPRTGPGPRPGAQ